jgi:hypothetical protein
MEFNPYREWLGLDNDGRRPDHYELLGLSRFEEDLELIRSAADAKTNTVRHVRPGPQVEVWQRLLDELSQTRQCLTDPASKRAYDEQLRQGLIPNEISTPLERAAVSNPLPPSLGPSPAAAAPALESSSPPATSPVVMPTPYSPAEPVGAYSPAPHPSVPPAGSAPADAPVPSGVPGYFAPGYYPAPPYGGFPGGAAGAMPAASGYPPLAMAIPVAPAQAPTVPAGMPAVPPGMPTLPPGMPPGGFMPAPYSPFSPPPGAGTVPHVPMNPGDPMAPVPGFMPGVYGGLPGYPSSVPPGNVLPVGGLASGVTAIPSAAEPLSGLSAPTVSASRTFVGRRRNQASLAISAIVCVVGVGVIVVLFGELQGRRITDPVESRVAQGDPNPGIRPDPEVTTPGVTKSPKMGPQRVVPARRPENGEPEPPDMPETPSEPAKPEEPAVKSDPQEPAPLPKPQPPNPEPSVPKPEPTPPTPEPMPQPPPAKKPQPDVNEVAQMVSALGLAKTALGERRLDEAKAQIEIASNLAKAPNFKAMTHRMELLHHYVVEFWKAVRESLKTANTIDELEVGNTRVAIVAASEESLTIRAAGQNLTYETMSLPAGVAMALATRWLDVKAPSTKIIRGAFHAVDPKGGDPAQARRLWEEAKLLGGEVDELMPVLDDKFDLASLPASKATVRQGTVPTSETIAAAAKQVKEKYAKEMSAAKNKEQKYALVKKLVEDAGVEMPNESYRYALLAEARDQSAAAKFAQLLVQVVDEMERWFKIDALEVKYESLSKAAATTTPGNARDFAIECLALTEKAIADKRYDLATKAAKVAHTTARRANDRDLAAKAVDKAREIGELSGKPAKPLEKTKPNGKAKPVPKTPAANGAEKPPFAKQAT